MGCRETTQPFFQVSRLVGDFPATPISTVCFRVPAGSKGCLFCSAQKYVTCEDYIYESVSFQIRQSANRGLRQSRAERQQGEVARVEKRRNRRVSYILHDRMSPHIKGAVVEAARLAHHLNQQQPTPFPTGWPNNLW